ncbi:hypothetical protein [Evansella clarkii]|uniref:hypothetical protein n=1 Tax=Evansella clarkii TaxID=79879 RepID=UPI001115B810|nr:hypothetical protein [Evansella clarkii]
MIAVESLSSVTQTLDNVTTGVDNTLMTGNIKSVVEEACRISPKLSDYGINFILLFFYYTIYMYDNHYWCSSFFYLFTV